uniref:Uncharacterized protein n=1 Tax=Romanomermis culicivorax TaxID=13658 RepID=A0A915INT5_ROMCU
MFERACQTNHLNFNLKFTSENGTMSNFNSRIVALPYPPILHRCGMTATRQVKETIYSTVQESNLIKLLTALANERLGEKSDSVKFKFWKCINPAGAEPRKYAKCLVRLMRTKNVKNFAPKSADELLAHDLALMSEFKEKSKVIRKLRFNLLTVHDKEVQSRKIATNTIDDQDRGQKFIDDQLERFQYMLNKLNLKEDRVLNILNQVSNLSRYIADRFPKSRFALSTTKNEARYQGSTSSARILSPRFFTMEDDGGTDDQWTLLSPDLFSLYENNKTNNILSLPSLIEDVPTPEKSFWWKFIAETVSTVKDDVRILSWNRSLEILYKEYASHVEFICACLLKSMNTIWKVVH